MTQITAQLAFSEPLTQLNCSKGSIILSGSVVWNRSNFVMCWSMNQNLGEMFLEYLRDAEREASNELSTNDNDTNKRVIVAIAIASTKRRDRIEDRQRLLVIGKQLARKANDEGFVKINNIYQKWTFLTNEIWLLALSECTSSWLGGKSFAEAWKMHDAE